MGDYGIKDTITKLDETIFDYISTEYFGKKDGLRESCKDKLRSKGVLYSQAYIEANNSYRVNQNGIVNSKVPDDVKQFLGFMASHGLGVYKNPYQHQVDALEAFYAGRDLFVSTGTGSGKTECFLWPLVSSLVSEIKNRPDSWKNRGVRAILIYPMNALVNDQIGRLRRVIGNEAEKFHDYLNENFPGLRHPQFGMYTGRTPYPGKASVSQQKELGKTLSQNLALDSDDTQRKESIKEKLQSLGKYPSKFDLNSFVQRLCAGEINPTDPNDAELVTRHEMQKICPDILITNYSMLEFMMLRNVEQKIWQDTKDWLQKDPNNKLLFILDEAHKYKGSAGAEVALLVRRVMHKLGIPREKAQFILTTASIPTVEGVSTDVLKFACDLTSQKFEAHNFQLIKGFKSVLPEANHDFLPEVFKDIELANCYGEGEVKRRTLKQIGEVLKWKTLPDDYTDSDLQNWLYENLLLCTPCQRMLQICGGKATSFDAIAEIIFPGSDQTSALKAIEILFSIMPMAKNKDGKVLFPARLHLFFRGLRGAYVCSNPNCSEASHEKNLGLGKVYLNSSPNRCKCGSIIYKLMNERSCGALFLQGFMDLNSPAGKFIWNQSGSVVSEKFTEVHFYVLPKDSNYVLEKDHLHGWLNSKTGLLTSSPPYDKEDEYLEVVYCLQDEHKRIRREKASLHSFSRCPNCGKNNCSITGFETRGNETFYNLIKEQFYHQPPVLNSEDLVNKGRKVLLFSDSRQKAALLARDLTRAADLDSMRKIICMAVDELNKNSEKYRYEATLALLYPAFLKVAFDNQLHFFFGQDKGTLDEDITKIGEKIKSSQRRGREFRFDYVQDSFSSPPYEYQLHLLNLLCNNFSSLTDHALCWLEPCSGLSFDLEDAVLNKMEKAGIKYGFDTFKQIFAIWAREVCRDKFSILVSGNDTARLELSKFQTSFGLTSEERGVWPSTIKKSLHTVLSDLSESQLSVLLECLSSYLEHSSGDSSKITAHYFLNERLITLCFSKEKDWYKCPKCGAISPFLINKKCIKCGTKNEKGMSQKEFESLSFWRKPVLQSIDRAPEAHLTRINTEEHTAQLSHRDQRQRLWSTTEDFEMRFQNIFINDNEPVDVLSCTTTMEVGIDIGSLTAIGLRNVPPTRENYQQRAGRAGRKGASVSTILTYADNRPHDSYYFHHPEKIIASMPSIPWIDINNPRLILRHIAVVVLSKALREMGIDISEESSRDFICSFFDDFVSEIRASFEELEADIAFGNLMNNTLPPDALGQIEERLEKMRRKYVLEADTELEDRNQSLLDAFINEGIFPSYSFPRDVLGFHIFDEKGKVVQRPERSLEMSLSEYAPGRVVVVNKNTYVSGGIFSNLVQQAKSISTPAETYFTNPAYFGQILICDDPACNWIGRSNPKKDRLVCPFCLKKTLKEINSLKPWGYAPVNGEAVRVAKADNEYTSVTKPSYSLTPKEGEFKQAAGFKYLRYVQKASQPLLILNKGNDDKGFMVCKFCGAAAPGNEAADLDKIRRPYKTEKRLAPCKHSPVNVYLGGEIRTDLILYEITLDDDKINTDSSYLWINRAAQSLAEALVLAAGRILDIEYSEIRSGYRIRRTSKKLTFVDIYLFDSLTSGAGYSSNLKGRSKELFEETKDFLLKCPSQCESACHDCLKNYGNQQVQELLDRFAAVQLIDWAERGIIPSDITSDQQVKLLLPLQELDKRWKVFKQGTDIYLRQDGVDKKVIVYPAMVKPIKESRSGTVYISDLYLRYALPFAEKEIQDQW